MKPKIQACLVACLEREGYAVTPQNLLETLKAGNEVAEEVLEIGDHSATTEYVVEIDGRYFQYTDEFPIGGQKIPFFFDFSTVCEVQRVEKTVIVFEEIERDQ